MSDAGEAGICQIKTNRAFPDDQSNSGRYRAGLEREECGLRILGIDPGTAIVGFGVLDKIAGGGERFRYLASGIIETPKSMDSASRLAMIRRDMLSILDEYQPDVVAVEAIFFFKNAKTLVPVSQARGVILEASAYCGKKVSEYTPMQVKMCITGHGRADKRFVQESVAGLLNLTEIIKPDDASDALAIAVCHARMGSGIQSSV